MSYDKSNSFHRHTNVTYLIKTPEDFELKKNQYDRIGSVSPASAAVSHVWLPWLPIGGDRRGGGASVAARDAGFLSDAAHLDGLGYLVQSVSQQLQDTGLPEQGTA